MLDFLLFDPALLTDPEIVTRLCLQVFLFCLSAFFSMSETALFSMSTVDLQRLRNESHPQSENLHRLLDYPRVLIVSILCGNELVNIAATVNLAGVLLMLYGNPEHAGWINIIIMFPLLLIFGEITPKTIAVTNTYNVATRFIAAPINFWIKFVKPLRSIVMVISNRLTTLVIGEQRDKEHLLSSDEIKTLLAEVTEHGEVSAIERIIIDNLLDSMDAEVVEIMIPRSRMIFVDISKPLPKLIKRLRRYKRARFPAYEGHPDNIVGILYTNDIARLVHSGADLSKIDVKSILRPVVAVPETKTIHEMLELFKHRDTPSALIFNEWGSVDGFVTLRQILRFLVGATIKDIDIEKSYQEIDEGCYVVSGQMNIERVNDIMSINLESSRMTTIGGLIFQMLDRLPVVGDVVKLPGLYAKVIEMKRHRIRKVVITSSASSIDSLELFGNESTGDPVTKSENGSEAVSR